MAGLDVVRQAAQVRRRIGLVGQNAAVDEILSGRQNLVMFGRLYHLGRRQAQRRADELLEHFGLADTGRKPVKQYSGGMRRRLDLAASLILAPSVLFADEPTTGLDPRGRNEVWASIRALVRDGTTVVLTTQYLDEADQLADQICVIDAGRVIAEGSPDGSSRSSAATGSTSSCATPTSWRRPHRSCPARAGAEADGRPDARRVSAPVRDRMAVMTAVLGGLGAAGITPEDFAVRRPTLDEVFMQLTGHRTDASAPAPVDDRRREGGSGMTAITESHHHPTRMDGMRWAISDTFVIVGRGIQHWIREPLGVIAGMAFMIMLVVLYGFLFGGAMSVPGGGNYLEFLMPGMFVMTMAFGIGETMAYIAADAERGVTDRFRSMPMRGLGRPARPQHHRHDLRQRRPGRDDRLRARARLALARQPGRDGGGHRPAAAPALRDAVGRHLPRPARAGPAAVNSVWTLLFPFTMVTVAFAASADDAGVARLRRRGEPAVGHDLRHPRPVRQPRRARARRSWPRTPCCWRSPCRC